MMIDDIIEFASVMEAIGCEYDLKNLLTFGRELNQAAELFKVTQINKLLKQFPYTIGKLIEKSFNEQENKFI